MAAYRLGSPTKAAKHLNITQPAVSQQIRTLEAQIKKPLFVRHARGIVPSAIAHDLARSIGTHIDAIEASFNAVQARATNIAGTIHIAGPGEYLSAKVTPLLSSLLEREIRVRLHIGGKDRIYALLDKGAIDLAFTASLPDSRTLDYQQIDAETLVMVATPDWIQQNLDNPLDIDQLLTQSLIAYDEELPLIRQYFRESFKHTLKVQAAITVADLRTVKQLVLAHQGYSVLPRYLCESQLQQSQLALIHVPQQLPTNYLNLVWNRGNLRHPRVAFAQRHFLTQLRPRMHESQ